jgi:hypothetical protein
VVTDPAGAGIEASSSPLPREQERLAGTLVHRLFQRDLDEAMDHATVAGLVAGLASIEEGVDIDDWVALADQVASFYLGLRTRPDVRAVLASGPRHYEVPFSFAPPDQPGVMLRGVMDCLVLPIGGDPVVLEVKTGQPRPEHEVQAARYAEAARAVLACDRVNYKILYA